MGSSNGLRNERAFVTFDTLRVDHPDAGAELIDIFTKEIRERVRHTAGFVSARAHVSLDGTTVVNSGHWADQDAYRRYADTTGQADGEMAYGIPGRSGVAIVATFRGVRDARIEGPAVTEPPGVVCVATRHLGGHEAAREVTALLVKSGQWKMHAVGFISATSYVSLDGTAYLNYPQWVDDESFEMYMADPKNAPGQELITPFEVAPAEFVICRVVSDIAGLQALAG